MDFNVFVSDINRQAAEVRNLTDRILPVKAGNIAVEHFKANFDKGGFVDNGLQKWKPSKRLLNGSKSAADNYPTLMSGRKMLYSDIKPETGSGEVIIQTTETTQDYAKVHNEGLKVNVPAHTRTVKKTGKKYRVNAYSFQMPKRQFIGDSRELNRKIENLIDSELQKITKL
jgi:phage gpG-like protein